MWLEYELTFTLVLVHKLLLVGMLLKIMVYWFWVLCINEIFVLEVIVIFKHIIRQSRQILRKLIVSSQKQELKKYLKLTFIIIFINLIFNRKIIIMINNRMIVTISMNYIKKIIARKVILFIWFWQVKVNCWCLSKVGYFICLLVIILIVWITISSTCWEISTWNWRAFSLS